MPKRRCLDCGTLTTATRCPTCTRTRKAHRNQQQAKRYDHTWRQHSARLRDTHVATNGWWCPGWDTPPHQATDLVVDHDNGVMCRACNGRKAGGWDKHNPHA